MAEKQVAGDGLPMNLAGMSKNQLYEIMSQMKTLIEQNQQQARRILIQNPMLTKALFQAQIMLGMVQPPQVIPNIQPAASQQSQQSAQPVQQSNIPAAAPLPGQIGLQEHISASQASNPVRKQQQNLPAPPVSTSIPPSNVQPPSLASHHFQSVQQPRGYFNAQTTAISLPQSSQVPPSLAASQPPSLLQPPMPTASTQLQQSLQTTGVPHMTLQPPLPPQPRPAPMPAFHHQIHSQMGPNAGFQNPGASQMHQSQPMFHSGSKGPASMGPSFVQGQTPLPSQLPPMYQGGSSHLGMDFSQGGSAMQAERGSPWMPGLPETVTGAQLPGPPPIIPGQMGSGNQPPRAQPLTPDMEKALLQQVMSLTPEQINLLPPEQRNQVLQLQQMLRQ